LQVTVAGLDFRTRTVGSSHNHVRPAARGFTMVELIVVMVLVGILGAIGAARFFDRRAFDTAEFAEQSRTMLRYAQKVAIAQNRPVFVRFDSESISLCFNSEAPCAPNQQVHAPGASNSAADGIYCTSSAWACERRPRNSAYTVSLGGMPRLMFFDALGRPFDAATNQPVGFTLTISGDGSSTPINVASETGYVF
jgi:MSHA pilin protein MshC